MVTRFDRSIGGPVAVTLVRIKNVQKKCVGKNVCEYICELEEKLTKLFFFSVRLMNIACYC